MDKATSVKLVPVLRELGQGTSRQIAERLDVTSAYVCTLLTRMNERGIVSYHIEKRCVGNSTREQKLKVWRLSEGGSPRRSPTPPPGLNWAAPR